VRLWRPVSAKGLIRRLDQMLGREEETITPLLPVPALSVEQIFPEPLQRDEDLLAVLGASGDAGFRHAGKTREGRAPDDGEFLRLSMERCPATKSDQPAVARFAPSSSSVYGQICPGPMGQSFGFDRLRLAVPEAESLSPSQQDLTGDCGGSELGISSIGCPRDWREPRAAFDAAGQARTGTRLPRRARRRGGGIRPDAPPRTPPRVGGEGMTKTAWRRRGPCVCSNGRNLSWAIAEVPDGPARQVSLATPDA
jgi:hypothetical protein